MKDQLPVAVIVLRLMHGLCQWDSGSSPNLGSGEFLTGTEVTITLIAQTGNQYAGTGVVSGASMSTTKTGEATVSIDFSFTGTVTETWA